MSRRTLLVVSAGWLLLAGVTGYEYRARQRLRAEADAFARRLHQLEAEVASLKQQRDATTRDLTEAERQLAALTTPKAEDKTIGAARRAEIKAWLTQVKRLRGLFDARPAQRIPEMQALTEEDWLRAAKVADLEDEENIRAALADVRNAAIKAFFSRLGPALRRYVKEAGSERPASTQVFAPFLEPADVPLLDRYEIVERSSALRGEGANWGVQNRIPTDTDYDLHGQVGPMGGASNTGPLAWDSALEARYRQALRNYTKANAGDYPKGMAEAVPFFDPPLDRETAERLVRTDRRR